MSALKMIAIGKKLSNIYSNLCLPICRKYELNQTCFDILLFFANNPQYNTARDICSVRGIKSGIASVAVEALIQGSYLESSVDPCDRRKNRLYPTPKAENVINDGRAMQKLFTEALKKGITDEELAAFESITNKIQANIELF